MGKLSTDTEETSNTFQSCQGCQAPEGSRHPLGGFIVNLKKIEINGIAKVLCSKCAIKAEVRQQVRQSKKENTLLHNLKNRLFKKNR